MKIADTGSIRQISECRQFGIVFDKIYVVDLATNCCGELVSQSSVLHNCQNYDNWLISLAQKMYKADTASFFGQMNLKHICAEITESASRYVVYYRWDAGAYIQEYRFSVCYLDENGTQLIFFQEALAREDKRPLEIMNELAHCQSQLQFLVNQVVEDFIEIQIETGACHVFSADSSIQTYTNYAKQLAWWTDHLIVPEERKSYAREYELESLTRNLRAHNGYHSAVYTTCSGLARNSILIISTLVKETYGKTQEYIFAYAQDITKLKDEETRNKQLVDISQQLLTLSQTEPVTGLFNRATCEKLIEEHLAAAKNASPGTMLLIDIDHFKEFNDRYGHSTGDFVLKFLGKTMQDIFRSDDIVSRWGGDEFVVFMRGVCNRKMIISRIERLRARLHQCRKDNDALPITISIGGEIAAQGMPLTMLFDHCDQSLYEVKSQGRNHYMIYSQ